MQRAVERGLTRRSLEAVRHVGLDKKSFGKGHSYVSVLTDLDGSRVLEVVADRTEEAADKLWNSLSAVLRGQVRGVAMDMWQPYLASTEKQAPATEIMHAKFHVSKHLNEAVDQVRRRENRAMMLKRHSENLLSYFRQPILNAISQGFNNKIQSLKSAARGFCVFENYRTRILFYCGKLQLAPDGISH